MLVGLDAKSSDRVAISLRLRWPDLEVLRAEGEQDLLRRQEPAADLVLFDARPAGTRHLVSQIKNSCNAVLMVLALEPDEAELVEMLEAGADDYLDLSASAPQLVARVSAALRRVQSAEEHPEAPVECGDLSMNPLTHEVLLSGEVIHLTPTEFKLLCHLAKNSDRLVTHEALQALLWGAGAKYYADSLRKYVQRVRQKIEEPASGRLRIETVPRTGYRLRETPQA